MKDIQRQPDGMNSGNQQQGNDFNQQPKHIVGDTETNRDEGRNGEEAKNDVQKAHVEADRDIAADPDLSAHSPNDDLDEGESARLGNNTPLV